MINKITTTINSDFISDESSTVIVDEFDSLMYITQLNDTENSVIVISREQAEKLKMAVEAFLLRE